MALPKALKRETREITLSDGQKMTVKALTRSEVLGLGAYGGDPIAGEIKVLAIIGDCSDDEAADWYSGAPFKDVQLIMDTVNDLAGLGETPKE